MLSSVYNKAWKVSEIKYVVRRYKSRCSRLSRTHLWRHRSSLYYASETWFTDKWLAGENICLFLLSDNQEHVIVDSDHIWIGWKLHEVGIDVLGHGRRSNTRPLTFKKETKRHLYLYLHHSGYSKKTKIRTTCRGLWKASCTHNLFRSILRHKSREKNSFFYSL